jgi:hypothetical protein
MSQIPTAYLARPPLSVLHIVSNGVDVLLRPSIQERQIILRLWRDLLAQDDLAA